jgi:hypothetical protein
MTAHPAWKDPFGSNRLGLWLADRRDRKAKQIGRVAARWGWLKPMGERGKVVWIVAGAERENVRLAIELLRAIRVRRLDIRLVLTFEHEYPDMLALLDDCDKTGWGYAPCDHPKAVARVQARFEPFGVILVGARPRSNLLAALKPQAHVLTVNLMEVLGFDCERVYAADEALAAQHNIAPVVDMRAILSQAQVDPNFKSLVNGPNRRHLWWLHQASSDGALVDAWRAAFADDVLFVSGARPRGAVQAISGWNREPPAAGSVFWVDDEKWLPGIAAAVTATHLEQFNASLMWQAMAGGAAISRAAGVRLPKAQLAEALPVVTDLISNWRHYRDNPIAARKHGDTARRLFWQERRLAEQVSAELVERVFEW